MATEDRPSYAQVIGHVLGGYTNHAEQLARQLTTAELRDLAHVCEWLAALCHRLVRDRQP